MLADLDCLIPVVVVVRLVHGKVFDVADNYRIDLYRWRRTVGTEVDMGIPCVGWVVGNLDSLLCS